MSAPENAIVAALLADATVAQLAGDGVFPLQYPEGRSLASGAITYQRLAMALANKTQEGDGPQDPRIQLNCWANGYDAADQLGDAVIAVLRPLHASLGISAVRIDDVPSIDSESGAYRRRLEYQLWVEG